MENQQEGWKEWQKHPGTFTYRGEDLEEQMQMVQGKEYQLNMEMQFEQYMTMPECTVLEDRSRNDTRPSRWKHPVPVAVRPPRFPQVEAWHRPEKVSIWKKMKKVFRLA